jgi:hypothetical protein
MIIYSSHQKYFLNNLYSCSLKKKETQSFEANVLGSVGQNRKQRSFIYKKENINWL